MPASRPIRAANTDRRTTCAWGPKISAPPRFAATSRPTREPLLRPRAPADEAVMPRFPAGAHARSRLLLLTRPPALSVQQASGFTPWEKAVFKFEGTGNPPAVQAALGGYFFRCETPFSGTGVVAGPGLVSLPVWVDDHHAFGDPGPAVRYVPYFGAAEVLPGYPFTG